MALFLVLVAVPLIEIGLFIQIGGMIGLWPTLAIVILTAVIGANLVRSQGFQALAGLRQSMNELSDPTRHLFDGAAVLFAGALLLTPGFLTDTIGLLLLIPPVRHAIFERLKDRVTVVGPGGRPGAGPHGPVPGGKMPGQAGQRGQGQVIDGEYSVEDDT